MNLHEYQGKSILASYGCVCNVVMWQTMLKKQLKKAKTINCRNWYRLAYVIKAQIHAGGRKRWWSEVSQNQIK